MLFADVRDFHLINARHARCSRQAFISYVSHRFRTVTTDCRSSIGNALITSQSTDSLKSSLWQVIFTVQHMFYEKVSEKDPTSEEMNSRFRQVFVDERMKL